MKKGNKAICMYDFSMFCSTSKTPSSIAYPAKDQEVTIADVITAVDGKKYLYLEDYPLSKHPYPGYPIGCFTVIEEKFSIGDRVKCIRPFIIDKSLITITYPEVGREYTVRKVWKFGLYFEEIDPFNTLSVGYNFEHFELAKEYELDDLVDKLIEKYEAKNRKDRACSVCQFDGVRYSLLYKREEGSTGITSTGGGMVVRRRGSIRRNWRG